MRHRPGVTPQRLTAIADQFSQAHAVYQQALLGALAQVLGRPDGSGRSDLETRVTALAEGVYSTSVEPMHSVAGEMFTAGVAGSGRKLSQKKDLTLQSLVLEGIGETLQELLTIVHHDALRVRKTFQRYAIELALARPRLGPSAALFVAQNRLAEVQFRISDRLGRQWQSTTFIHNLVRGFMLSTLVESFLYALAQTGTDKARFVWADGSHEPIDFSISGVDPGLPAYLTLKASVLHPNSNATVETLR